MKMTTAKGAKKSAHRSGGKKGHPHRMTIEKADNGFTVTTHHKHPDPKRTAMNHPMPYMPEPEPDNHVFSSANQVAKHVKSTFGGAGSPEEEAAEGEA